MSAVASTATLMKYVKFTTLDTFADSFANCQDGD